MHPLNTSDHTAITAKIPLKTDLTSQAPTKKESTRQEKAFQKPRWAKCNKHLYKDTVENMLREVTIDPNTDSPALLGLEIKKLENILQHATKTSIEGHKSHAGTKKPRGRGKWNSEISEASQNQEPSTRRSEKAVILAMN